MKKTQLLPKVAAGALIVATAISATAVQAAGFQITEQSVVGMGRSHAGAGVVGDDLSAVFYNPAGMTLLSGTRVQTGAALVSLDIPYSGKIDGSKENGRDKPAVIPNFFITHQLKEDLWVGLGLTAPYGMKVRYGDNWSQNQRGISASIVTVDINPSIAWKINDKISVGAGLSALYTTAKIKNGLPSPLPANSHFAFKGEDWMLTYDVGVMVTPIESVNLGLSYRSSAKVKAKGDYSMKLNGIFEERTLDGVGRLETPETVMFSGTWLVNDKLRFSSLVRWANWKNFDRMTFSTNDATLPSIGPFNPNTVSTQYDWKAAWLFSLGADIMLNDQWTIRGGIGLETDPIQDKSKRTALIPDTKRLWLTCGISYAPTKNLQIDAAYGHIRGIGNRDLYDGIDGNIVGEFEHMNAWLGGVQVQYRF